MNLTTPVPLSFETERLLIRRYQPEDKQVLYAAARSSIAHVFEFLPWCHPDYSEQDAEDWLATIESNWQAGRAYSFAIFSRDGSEFHGGCGINRIDEHPVGNLGYWIKAGSTGQGIATEATIALAEFGILKIGLQRVEILMSIENQASRNVAVSAGACFEGIVRDRLMLHGKPHDAYLYSIIPGDLKR